MSASNSGDSMPWGRGRSTGSRKGKRTGNSSSDKPRQPQRGLGVAQLEKIRIENEMAEYLHHPLVHQPPIHRTGSFNLEDARLAHSLPPSPSSFHANTSVSLSYPTHRPNLAEDAGLAHSLPPSPSSSFHANTSVSASYPIHRPNLAVAYGERGDIRFQTNPVIRSPYYNGAIFASDDAYSRQSNVTLPLFEPEESICLKRHLDVNQSVDTSLNPDDDDQQEVDLELKL